MPLHSKPKTDVLYNEVVYPGVSIFLSLAFLAPAIALVLWPVSAGLAMITGLTAYGAAVAIMIGASPRITVTKTSQGIKLRVKGAEIFAQHLGKATLVTPADQRVHKGPALDARSFRSFQVGAKDLVKIDILDTSDPTPYWLISSRRGQVLADLVNAK